MSTIDGTTATFQLTIRCAMQSFPDHTVECPADWNVLQLKTHLAEQCVTKPEPSRQRLIYAGRCLDNEQKVRDVLAQRRDGIVRNEVAEKQVIHMVYIGGKNSSPHGGLTPSQRNSAPPTATGNAATSEGLRHRGTNGGGQQNLSSSQMTNYMTMPQHQYYAAFHHPQQQQSYEAWMSAYQNYINQMAQFYHQPQMPYASAAQMAQQQAYAFVGTQMPTAPAQHQRPQFGTTPMVPAPPHFNPAAFQPPHNNNNMMMMMAAAVPQQQQQQQEQQRQQQRMVGGEAAAAEGAGQADLLDIVYKSVRFVLLAMVLYVYSSLERFFLVLAVVAFFWFVHRRRNQQQANAAPENGVAGAGGAGRDVIVANVPPPLRAALPQQQRQQPNAPAAAAAGDNNNAAETDGQTPPEVQQQQTTNTTTNGSDNISVHVHQPSAWNVFFTVVQSFFTSLVPNPMPAGMDIN